PAGQRQGDLELTLLAVREMAHLRAGAIAEADGGQRLLRANGEAVIAPQRPEHHELGRFERLDGEQAVLLHGERAEEVRDLKRAGETERRSPVGRDAGHVPPEEPDRAGGDRQLTRDQVEERRLTRAVGPDQRAALARPHGERDGVDGPQPAEGLADSAQREGVLAFSHAVTRSTTSWSRPLKPWYAQASQGGPSETPPLSVFTSMRGAPVRSLRKAGASDAGENRH